MNIALTGSSGLLGSHLCNDLKKMGHNILCISSSKSSPQDQIYSYQQILSGDLNIQVDYILHLATINSNLSESQISHEVNLAKKVGLTYKGELKLSLSALNAGGFKYEPIFIFIKEQ